ncbi:hypothetical protein PBY51_012820 [Eleginops maclovinus]|uniref:Uncharacterized protein n=1 Tax=Eleginops maclovinus TaxID=56733 RepID=A0AAN7Y5D6_ELEMC|nr:hypothetical protein PBY51_012820 [Eleginops maclovinus]
MKKKTSEGGGGWEGRRRRRQGRGSRKQGEEGALLRLLPLSFRCCALQRQEAVLKGGVWKKIGGKKDGRKGEKGSAWAALQQLQLQQPVRRKEGEKETEGRKRRLPDCL